jgi:hypothetical protein
MVSGRGPAAPGSSQGSWDVGRLRMRKRIQILVVQDIGRKRLFVPLADPGGRPQVVPGSPKHPSPSGSSSSMNQAPSATHGASKDLTDRIQTRLDEITTPDYEDPARRDLDGLDWSLFLAFVLGCAAGALLWGY